MGAGNWKSACAFIGQSQNNNIFIQIFKIKQIQHFSNLKGLSHEMDLAFDDMYSKV